MILKGLASKRGLAASLIAWSVLLTPACRRQPRTITDLAEPITSPGWIRFRTDVKVDPATFFERYGRLLELSQGTTMRLTSTSPDDIGETHYRFQQYFQNIEVEGAEFIIHARDGRAISANGPIAQQFQPSVTQAQITEARALAAVTAYLQTDTFLRPDQVVADVEANARGERLQYQPRGTLVYTQTEENPSQRVLAWRFDAYTLPLDRSRRIYVDAATGRIVKQQIVVPNCYAASGPTSFRGNQNFNTGKRDVPDKGERFVLLDDCHMNQLHELSFNVTSGSSKEIFDSDNSWFDVDRGEVTSFWALGIAYDYFDLVLGRKSFDGKNGNMVIVNDPTLGDNARGGGGTITIGIAGAGSSTDDYNTTDIVGHEFTHSLIEKTAGLAYVAANESAALNESFCDMFGEMVKAWEERASVPDWTIGSEKGCTGTQICRDMKNPKRFSQPDTYQGKFWQTGAGIDPHTNGTVQDRWYSLLVEGGSGTSELGTQYAVTGIGVPKATRIAYRTLTHYLTASAGYVDARDASIESARDLFGAGSAEEGEVTKAWCAVGLCPYKVPTQADRFDRPNGNPNPTSPNNNNSLAGATPVLSSAIVVPIGGGTGTPAWTLGRRPVLHINDLSIFPAGDSDNFRIAFPKIDALGGRCFSSGYSFVFSADVDARAYLDGKLLTYAHQTRSISVTLANTNGDFVLQISAPFAGQILNYNIAGAFYQSYDPLCFQTRPPSKIDQIRGCPMCNFEILSGIDRVILEADYRRPDYVAPQEHYFSFDGGRLSVPVTVKDGNGLKVTLVDGSGREIQSATRAGDSNQLTVGGTVPAGVYSLRFSGYGNGTQLEVRTPVQR